MTTVGALLRQLLVNGTAALSATLSPGETWPSSAGMQRQWTETTAGPTAPPPPPPRAADDATLNATAAVAAVAVAPSAKNIYSQSLLNISRWLAAGNGTLSGTYDTDSSNANAGFRVAGDATTATTAVGERVTAAVAVGAAVNATTADALATVAATAGHERVSFAFTDDYDIYAQMWRDNLTFFNETANVTSLGDDGGGGVKPPAYWALLLLIFPVLTVFGNVLVVLSVYFERSLRSPTNYFIVSLAVADIMVAVLVMPLAVYVEAPFKDPLDLQLTNIDWFICLQVTEVGPTQSAASARRSPGGIIASDRAATPRDCGVGVVILLPPPSRRL
ncbi:hypothetical protein LSAT2_005036, partial [Lamellibrachia satsuma]